jgi:hypothetical protein
MADTLDDGMVSETEIGDAGGIPWHFWAIAAVGLLWNSYGAWDYTSYQLGMTPPIPAIETAPLWATSCWALGVWGSFVGSILMLIRSRHATIAFAVSFVTAIVSFAWQFSAGIVPTPVLPLVILAAVAFFWWYAVKMRDAGVLT